MAARLLRLSLLFAAPGITAVVAPGPLALATAVSSLLAVGLDFLRQRSKGLPYPIFLLLVYASQLVLVVGMWQYAGSLGDAVLDGSSTLESQDLPLASLEDPPYPKKIKTMSIVMAAHNEHKYMARTLASIYERTPEDVLQEVIVVDDASDPPLAGSMVDYPQVKILRQNSRLGLIKSKYAGGNAASGDMIMFLDAHVCPEWKWTEPLLKHVNTNYKRVVVPVIPILDGETWKVNSNAVGIKMMFDWTLFFQWFEDGNDLVPCMSGGLFAITRQWWHESGEYDYAMNMWGAENIEQSIRVWLCGGEIYVARDSRVAHVFRSSFPYKIDGRQIYLNKVRTVETWFDEYKEYYYAADPGGLAYKNLIGSLEDRMQLKQKLQCKPFQWYVDKFIDVFKTKHMIPEEVFLIRGRDSKLCVASASDKEHLVMEECNLDVKRQQWTVGLNGAALHNSHAQKCLDANAGEPNKDGMAAFMYVCYPDNAQQNFQLSSGNIRWTQGYCVEPRTDEELLVLRKCAGFLEATGPFEKYSARMMVP